MNKLTEKDITEILRKSGQEKDKEQPQHDETEHVEEEEEDESLRERIDAAKDRAFQIAALSAAPFAAASRLRQETPMQEIK